MRLYKNTLIVFTTNTGDVKIGRIVGICNRASYYICGTRTDYVVYLAFIDQITKLELTVEEEELLTRSK